MLLFENPYGIPITNDDVARATLLLCQAQLIEVARAANLQLYQGSFDEFSHRVRGVIHDPTKALTPSELVIQARLFALRGAQAMVALKEPELRFHEFTWNLICPCWPFC